MIEHMEGVDRPVTSTVTIAGVRIDKLSFETVVETIIDRALSGGTPSYVVTPNASHIVMLQDDPLFREIYDQAFLSVPDGVPLLWAANLLGTPLAGRVNGTDLFEALCARAETLGLRVFLLGGREGAALKASERLRARHPSLRICGTYCPPFGFENSRLETQRILSAVEAAKPDLLFVGLGAPKQEYWMYRHLDTIHVPVSLGVGVSFEFVGGVVARAPRWMQSAGLEWFYRLCSEPARLWKRYVFGNARFCRLMALELIATISKKATNRASYRTLEADDALISGKGVKFKRQAILEPWHFLADVLLSESTRK